ncbi:MAG: efflux RND transporter periplasmic adaptor subunit, partial [Kangiellaceae bacterium]|nr:efflux RND transporter periplasmic adaptor subunit [Kangiellaceae bacterium]
SMVISSNLLAEEVILTGRVKAGDVQNFTVPWSETWRQQIKWMKPEGEIVEQGELVVLFDTANLDSQVEQQEVQLRQSKEKAKESLLGLEQKIIDAEHALEKARLEHQLAKLVVEVPTKFRSDFEKDNLEFDYKKTGTLLEQARTKLQTAKDELIAERKKQAIETQRISAILEKYKRSLNLLQIKAMRKGTVLHAMHPWNGTKISEGQSVQTAWRVASIPGMGGESIESWVNEVDRHKLKLNQGVSLTLDAYPKNFFSGSISSIGRQAEKRKEWGSAAYYPVKIKIIEAPKQKLIPGMSVRIELKDHLVRETSYAKDTIDVAGSADTDIAKEGK